MVDTKEGNGGYFKNLKVDPYLWRRELTNRFISDPTEEENNNPAQRKNVPAPILHGKDPTEDALQDIDLKDETNRDTESHHEVIH